MQSEQSDDTTLIVQLAERIYGHHVHNGRPHVSMAYAVKCAANLIGVAKSAILSTEIEQAQVNPRGALEWLRDAHSQVPKRADDERRRLMHDLAVAIKNEGGM